MISEVNQFYTCVVSESSRGPLKPLARKGPGQYIKGLQLIRKGEAEIFFAASYKNKGRERQREKGLLSRVPTG